MSSGGQSASKKQTFPLVFMRCQQARAATKGSSDNIQCGSSYRSAMQQLSQFLCQQAKPTQQAMYAERQGWALSNTSDVAEDGLICCGRWLAHLAISGTLICSGDEPICNNHVRCSPVPCGDRGAPLAGGRIETLGAQRDQVVGVDGLQIH